VKLKAQFADGTELPSDTTIILNPETTGVKYVVSGSMPVDGEFLLATSYEGAGLEGAPPGKYKVTVSVGAGAVELAGPKPTPECTDPAKTPLTVDISESGTVTPNPLMVPKAG
jgi:hypothetical protein